MYGRTSDAEFVVAVGVLKLLNNKADELLKHSAKQAFPLIGFLGERFDWPQYLIIVDPVHEVFWPVIRIAVAEFFEDKAGDIVECGNALWTSFLGEAFEPLENFFNELLLIPLVRRNRIRVTRHCLWHGFSSGQMPPAATLPQRNTFWKTYIVSAG